MYIKPSKMQRNVKNFNKTLFLFGFFDAHTNSWRRRPSRGSQSFRPPIIEGATAIPWDTTTATHSGGQLFAPLQGSCKGASRFFCIAKHQKRPNPPPFRSQHTINLLALWIFLSKFLICFQFRITFAYYIAFILSFFR